MPSYTEVRAVLESDALLERLATVEHQRWAHWQQYLHARCRRTEDGSLVIPPELAKRWATQIATPYAELTDAEKESDREQVRRYLPILIEAIATAGAGPDL